MHRLSRDSTNIFASLTLWNASLTLCYFSVPILVTVMVLCKHLQNVLLGALRVNQSIGVGRFRILGGQGLEYWGGGANSQQAYYVKMSHGGRDHSLIKVTHILIILNNPSRANEPIWNQISYQHPGIGRKKIFQNSSGHITNMATIPIYKHVYA